METLRKAPSIICPNPSCTKTPTVQITGLNLVELSCPCSKNIMKLSIQSYINTIKSNKNKSFPKESNLCKTHPTQSNIGYCYNCDQHFCYKCPNAHVKSKHEITRLTDLMSEDEFGDINKGIVQMKDFIINIETKVNTIYAELLRKAETIKKMYNEWKQQMQVNLYLIDLLIKDYVSYDSNSFYTIDNILANCNFSFNTAELDSKLVDPHNYALVRNYLSRCPNSTSQVFASSPNIMPTNNKLPKTKGVKEKKSANHFAIVARDYGDNDDINNNDTIPDNEDAQSVPKKKAKSTKKSKKKAKEVDDTAKNILDNENTEPQNLNKKGLISNENGITQVRQINRHSDRTNLLIVLPDKRLCSCSCDGNIIIYNDNTTGANTIRINNAHGKNISIKYICYLQNNHLVSCGADKNLKFWAILSQSYELIKTLKSHTGTVNKVIQLTYPQIASCSEDSTIMIWNAETYKKIATLEGHKGSVYAILYIDTNDTLISTGKDSILRLWNISSRQCLKKRKGIFCFESSHALCELTTGNIALSGRHQIVIFEPDNLEVLDIIEDSYIKDTFVSCFLNIGNNLICGTDCGKMCNIDLETNNIVFKDEVHFDFISSLVKYGKNLFVSGSWDMSRIKFWKF